jgi:hypothetical protein
MDKGAGDAGFFCSNFAVRETRFGPSRELVQRTDTSEIEVQADITRTSLFGR